MIIYLSGVSTFGFATDYFYQQGLKPSYLESYYYLRGKRGSDIIQKAGNFILDSGAFTFGQFGSKKKGEKINWEEYVEQYADFIRKNSVDKFFELDIDSITGYDRVVELRNRLEKLAGRPSIPVWHKNRGLQNFLDMCEAYRYVAIGGIVAKEVLQKDHEYFSYFIREAHKRGAKIHGLGFTNTNRLKDFHFDSVDSCTWNAPAMYRGFIPYFSDGTIKKVYTKKGFRNTTDYKKLVTYSLGEWIKYQKYAETHL